MKLNTHILQDAMALAAFDAFVMKQERGKGAKKDARITFSRIPFVEAELTEENDLAEWL
jgi:hypothetical protein